MDGIEFLIILASVHLIGIIIFADNWKYKQRKNNKKKGGDK